MFLLDIIPTPRPMPRPDPRPPKPPVEWLSSPQFWLVVLIVVGLFIVGYAIRRKYNNIKIAE